MGPRFPPRIPPARRRARGARRRAGRGAHGDRRHGDARRHRRAALSARRRASCVHSFDRPNIALRFAAEGQAAPADRAISSPAISGDSGIVYAASRDRTEIARRHSLSSKGHRALAYHAGLEQRRAQPQPGRLPAGGRRRDRRDDRLRHGHQQARRALRRACRHAGRHRELLPGDRPRRPRRPAGRHADPLRPRRHGAPAPPDRREGAERRRSGGSSRSGLPR